MEKHTERIWLQIDSLSGSHVRLREIFRIRLTVRHWDIDGDSEGSGTEARARVRVRFLLMCMGCKRLQLELGSSCVVRVREILRFMIMVRHQ